MSFTDGFLQGSACPWGTSRCFACLAVYVEVFTLMTVTSKISLDGLLYLDLGCILSDFKAYFLMSKVFHGLLGDDGANDDILSGFSSGVPPLDLCKRRT